jgi:L-amino acid N-acyltransferase YncA
VLVRPAQPSDLEAIRDILNREIEEGVAHFGLEPVTADELAAELARQSHPWFSALDSNRVVGFARAYPWKPRGAYSRTAEVGVYVAPEAQGRGVGGLLYRSFLPVCRQAGLETLLAGIRLHDRFGFGHVGTLPRVGFKFGQWHDVGYWAKVAEGEDEAASQFPTSPTR